MESPKNVRFLFKDVKVSEKERVYILKKVDQLDKILDDDSQKEIEVDRDKFGELRLEVMVKTPHNLYRAEETTESIEGSIDLVVDSLKTQINRDKDRRKTLIKRGAQSIKKKSVVDGAARF